MNDREKTDILDAIAAFNASDESKKLVSRWELLGLIENLIGWKED